MEDTPEITPEEITAKLSGAPQEAPAPEIKTDLGDSFILEDPYGDLKEVPKSEALQAIQQGGYKMANPEKVFEANQEAKYTTPTEKLKAAAEGAASAATFGLSTAAEKQLFGAKDEDILGRAKYNPYTHGAGQVAGIVATGPLGELGAAGLLERSGAKVAQSLGLGGEGASTLSKLGYGSVKEATSAALFQGGNEVSKMLANDPDQSLQTAATNIGLAGLIGAPIGGAMAGVSPLWEATSGNKVAQFIDEFKGRIKERLDTPDPVGALKNELTDFHKNITSAADEVYGATGIKAQDIAKTIPEKMTPAIEEQAARISSQMDDVLMKMRKSPESYPARLVEKLENDAVEFVNKVGNKEATPADVFNAAQDLKQTVQGYSKFDKFVKPVDEGYDFVQKMKSLGHDLRNSLEDDAVWGKAATRQKEINAAFREYLPTLKDFEKRFTTEVNGERVVDPAKINTYVNQLGKPNAELKQEMLKNFLDASEKYKGVIEKSHANLGIESPFQGGSLNYAKQSIRELPAGAKLADTMIAKGFANLGGEAIGASIGGVIGHSLGSPLLGALVGEHALGHFFASILPGIVKPILEGANSPGALKSAIDYGMAVVRGETLINKGMKNVFKAGVDVLPSHLIPDEKRIQKLDKTLTMYRINPEKMLEHPGKAGGYLPQHNQANGVIMANATNYLNSLRPDLDKKAPLDSQPKENAVQKSVYDRQVAIAEQPLLVLQHVKNGTVQPQDLVTLKAIYPSLYAKLAQGLTTQMTDHLSKGEIIPYHTRMGLSVFMGQPMDSTMTPQAIMANQAAAVQTAQQKAPAPQKSMNSLSKLSMAYATPAQAREAHHITK